MHGSDEIDTRAGFRAQHITDEMILIPALGELGVLAQPLEMVAAFLSFQFPVHQL
jgi:hypothetical protein